MKKTFFLLAIILYVTPFGVSAGILYNATPLIISEEATPRDILYHTIVVKNTGTVPVTLYPTVNNIKLGEGGGIEEFITPTQSDKSTSLANWIEVSRRGIDLPSGASHNFEITIRVSLKAVPGTYHAFISFAPGRTRDIAEEKVRQGGTPGTIVTVTIKDTKDRYLRLTNFVVDKFIVEATKGEAHYTVSNPGDEALVPRGEIVFYNSKGEEVGTTIVNPERKEVTPGTTLELSSPIPAAGLLGKYKALLTLEYGTAQTASLTDTSYFYVLSWKKLLLAFGIFLTSILVLMFFVARRYGEDDDDDDYDEGSFVNNIPFKQKNTSSIPLEHDVNLKPQHE